MPDYSLKTTVDLSYEAAIDKVTELLKEQGFGILTQIDVKATLKQKLDVDTTKYIILGACNPNLAYQAIRQEADIGALLPCNVVVYEDESTSKTVVTIIDPSAMMQMTGNADLADLATDARGRMDKVIAALQSS